MLTVKFSVLNVKWKWKDSLKKNNLLTWRNSEFQISCQYFDTSKNVSVCCVQHIHIVAVMKTATSCGHSQDFGLLLLLHILWQIWCVFVFFLSLGLVQPRSGVRPGRVLRSIRRSRLPPSPELPEGSDGIFREQRPGRPHTAALQLCLLRIPRPRKQVHRPTVTC